MTSQSTSSGKTEERLMVKRKQHSLLLWLTLSAMVCLAACKTGNGVAGTDKRNLKDFQYIVMSCDAALSVEQGEAFQVSVTADSDLVGKVNTFVTNETLYVSAKDVSSKTPLVVRITLPRLKGVTTTKASAVVLKEIYSPKLKVDIQGNTQAVLSGEIRDMELLTSNTTIIDASALKTQNMVVTVMDADWVSKKMSGSKARIDVHAKQSLEVTMKAGRLRYVVAPKQWKKQIGQEAIIEKWNPAPAANVVTAKTTTTTTTTSTKGKTGTTQAPEKTKEQKRQEAINKAMGY